MVMEDPVPRGILLDQSSRQDVQPTHGPLGEYARFNGGGDRFYIRKIADEAKAHGTQLIFVYLPMFNGSRCLAILTF